LPGRVSGVERERVFLVSALNIALGNAPLPVTKPFWYQIGTRAASIVPARRGCHSDTCRSFLERLATPASFDRVANVRGITCCPFQPQWLRFRSMYRHERLSLRNGNPFSDGNNHTSGSDSRKRDVHSLSRASVAVARAACRLDRLVFATSRSPSRAASESKANRHRGRRAGALESLLDAFLPRSPSPGLAPGARVLPGSCVA
jgi:hypothetical protein